MFLYRDKSKKNAEQAAASVCLRILGLADESKIYAQGTSNSVNSQNNNPDGGDDGNSRGSGGSTPDSNSQSENRNKSRGPNQSEGNSQNGSDNTGRTPCDSTTFSQRQTQAFRDFNSKVTGNSSLSNLHRNLHGKERRPSADWLNLMPPSSRDMMAYSDRRTVSKEGGRSQIYGKSYHHEMSGGRYLALPPRYIGERYPHHERELGYQQHRDSSHTHRYPLPESLMRLHERFIDGEEYNSHWDHVAEGRGDHGYGTDDYYRDYLATDKDLHSNHHQQSEPLNLSVAQHNR